MTTPSRRWSFNLRTLFVVVTVLALIAHWASGELQEWLFGIEFFTGPEPPVDPHSIREVLRRLLG